MEFNVNFLLNLYKITQTMTNASPLTVKNKRVASENEMYHFLSVVHFTTRLWVCCYTYFITYFLVFWCDKCFISIVKHYVIIILQVNTYNQFLFI